MGILTLFIIREFFSGLLIKMDNGIRAYVHARKSAHFSIHFLIWGIEILAVMYIHDEMAHMGIISTVAAHEMLPLMYE